MTTDDWPIAALHRHLQYAIQLEYWTIPYYMTALYSVKDRENVAYPLVQSVVHQEMLHVQLACNVANAFETPITLENCFPELRYEDDMPPHLRFGKDDDIEDPRESFRPFSARLGPLDECRINAMCLIEYPFEYTGDLPRPGADVTEYTSIGQFYRAVIAGAAMHAKAIKGQYRQVDFFRNFYRNLPGQTVSASGPAGLADVMRLLYVIVDQGEGERRFESVPFSDRNTADGFNEADDHFDKFNGIKTLLERPETYRASDRPSAEGLRAQDRLAANFTRFRRLLVDLFNGQNVDEGGITFGELMPTLGANILSCWKNGAVPRFHEI